MNYTPLNQEVLKGQYPQVPQKSSSIHTILLLIGTLIAVVLAFLLFVLIQKKMQQNQYPALQPTVSLPTPTIFPPTPTPALPTVVLTLSPTASVSATPLASPSAAMLTPTKVATPSATKAP